MEKLVKNKMEGVCEFTVPIVVDIGWGKNWDEAH
jgi:DNA polymerase I-like protein with 3'-5' exonuclease and polymerase domains